MLAEKLRELRLRWLILATISLGLLLSPVGGLLIGPTAGPAFASSSVGGNDYPWGSYDGPGSDPATYTWFNPSGTSSNSPLGFGYRNCTDYVAYELNEQMGGNTTNNIKFSWSKFGFANGNGNAVGWEAQTVAELGSKAVSGTPAVGAVAWWNGSWGGGYGHVAIVANVTYSGSSVSSIVVDDYNYLGTGNYDSYTINNGASNWPDDFLHIADIAGTSTPSPGTSTPQVASYVDPSGTYQVITATPHGVYETYWGGDAPAGGPYTAQLNTLDATSVASYVDPSGVYQVITGTPSGVYETWWGGGTTLGTGRLNTLDATSVASYVDPSGVYQVITGTPSGDYETWWGGGTTLGTGQLNSV